MNYQALTGDQAYSKMNGTSLQGYIYANYDLLRELFGDPIMNDGYKTDAEWCVEFDDGTIATIYNYKDGYNYNGSNGLAIHHITNWHIGGKNQKASDYINELLTNKNEG